MTTSFEKVIEKNKDELKINTNLTEQELTIIEKYENQIQEMRDKIQESAGKITELSNAIFFGARTVDYIHTEHNHKTKPSDMNLFYYDMYNVGVLENVVSLLNNNKIALDDLYYELGKI